MDISLFDYVFAHQTHMTYGKSFKHINYIRNESSKNRITLRVDEWIFGDYWPVTNKKVHHESLADYALLLEPREYKSYPYNNINQVINKYNKILTYDNELLERGAPFEFYPFGGCWIPEELYGIPEKDKNTSFIYSDKKQLEGHKLRHSVNSWISTQKLPVDTYGKGTERPLKCKSEGLQRYRFSLVIENVRKDWWFTEKLLDCFALGVVPIYWGCPDIGRFFDTKGMIIVNDINEIKQVLNSLNSRGEDGEITAEMIYEGKRNSISQNFELFKQYDSTDCWLYENIFKKYNAV